ncbi:MAG: hypothetical protein Aurels2KO_12500 [Aureliella sp.]
MATSRLNASKVTLEPTRLHWIRDDGMDDAHDLCAHSPVHFSIQGNCLMSPDGDDVTVSAAVIYLLRTLELDHTSNDPVGDHLFPCCGHAMYDTGDEDVVICGCSNGTDFSVKHVGAGEILVRSVNDQSYLTTLDEWRAAVNRFSDCVLNFYDRSIPKTPADDTDAAGFAKLMSEWKRRRGRP